MRSAFNHVAIDKNLATFCPTPTPKGSLSAPSCG